TIKSSTWYPLWCDVVAGVLVSMRGRYRGRLSAQRFSAHVARRCYPGTRPPALRVRRRTHPGLCPGQVCDQRSFIEHRGRCRSGTAAGVQGGELRVIHLSDRGVDRKANTSLPVARLYDVAAFVAADSLGGRLNALVERGRAGGGAQVKVTDAYRDAVRCI